MALGDLLASDNKLEDARFNWQEVVAAMATARAGRDFPAMTLLARALVRENDLATATALSARVRASEYRHPEFVELTQELNSGHWVRHVKSRTRGI